MKRALVLLVSVCLLSSCAFFDRVAAGHGDRTKSKQGRKKALPHATTGSGVPLDTREFTPASGQATNTASNMSENVSPQRRASLQVVAQGKQLLSQRQHAQALQYFQDAATLDGSNGIAYYYIARTYYELGQFGSASGVLTRAESLLASDAQWSMSVRALREALQMRGTT